MGMIIKIAIPLVIIVALGLFLFLPYAPAVADVDEYGESAYFPLIEKIEDYRLSLERPFYKNNFESLMGLFGSAIKGGIANDDAPNMAPGGASPDNNLSGGMGGAMENGTGAGNGSYVESTDNQVEGVIESDLMKMTDKYIFRLGYKTAHNGSIDMYEYSSVLRVYSIDKENSALISEFNIPLQVIGSYYGEEMFLSLDGNTVTVIYYSYDNNAGGTRVGVISIDVSDVNNIKLKGQVLIDGSLKTTRMVDGKLLLITEYYFNRNSVDYAKPETFVPSIDSGDGASPIEFDDIIYPDEIGNTRYSVVTLLDAENLTLLGANALLNFTSDVYISENNVYISREYFEKTETNDGYISENMSDIAVIGYSDDGLNKKGIITAKGFLKDQYSFDEREGYLRIVSSTTIGEEKNHGDTSSFSNIRNVSLYIYDLKDNSLAYSVENFAIEGEEATAVRFIENKLYVCTALVVTFSDPVYFFDLSDYENITFSDTGIIEGFSTSLINYGEGFALGIGREDWTFSKVEVYEERDGKVVSVDEYKFRGSYSENYKCYLVDRENNLFGFAADYFYDENMSPNQYGEYYANRYILLHFDGYQLRVIATYDSEEMSAYTTRAAFIDGYLYITTPTNLKVIKVF